MLKDTNDRPPKVSVIIPSYNHAHFIERTISSVINQTYKNLELIVIDDGSADGSVEILENLKRKMNFTLITKPNEGLTKTLNRGLDLAKGEFIVVFGSDDLMPEERISEQVACFDQFSAADVVTGNMIEINANDKRLKKRTSKKLGWIAFNDLLDSNFIYAPTAMIRRSVFQRIGNYDPKSPIEDYYLWMKLLNAGGKIYVSDRVWAYYRVGASNLEKKFVWYYEGAKYVLSKYQSQSDVQAALKRLDIKFAIKMTLINGARANDKYPVTFQNISPGLKVLIQLLGMIPKYIRHLILKP